MSVEIDIIPSWTIESPARRDIIDGRETIARPRRWAVITDSAKSLARSGSKKSPALVMVVLNRNC